MDGRARRYRRRRRGRDPAGHGAGGHALRLWRGAADGQRSAARGVRDRQPEPDLGRATLPRFDGLGLEDEPSYRVPAGPVPDGGRLDATQAVPAGLYRAGDLARAASTTRPPSVEDMYRPDFRARSARGPDDRCRSDTRPSALPFAAARRACGSGAPWSRDGWPTAGSTPRVLPPLCVETSVEVLDRDGQLLRAYHRRRWPLAAGGRSGRGRPGLSGDAARL